MKKGKLAKNTISSLLLQVCTIVSGFVLPRLILSYYGSAVNGLVNSITQFLQIISFMEFGVGAVVQSALYKPLAIHDDDSISKIVTSARKFFKRIGQILLCYIVILTIAYPFITNQNFNNMYTAILIASMSISFFAQYYFGIVDQLLITADQRGYIHYTAQILVIVTNTVLCSVMIVLGGSIQVVKLTTSLIYLVRPIFVRLYINKHYSINRKSKYEEDPIKQKWNGLAQHVTAVVLDSTDTIVLTILATLSDVSIYSVYHLVVYGVKTLYTSMTNGIQALLGELWAIRDIKNLEKTFAWTEWVLHTSVVLVFGCTGMLILPFVEVYTRGVTDANYSQPLFAILIVLAHGMHCIRLPYHIMIKAGGHYKETQRSYIIATALNLIISILMVKFLGLVGVAIGTLISMMYQTLWIAVYNSKHLMRWPFKRFAKQITVDTVSVAVGVVTTKWITLPETTYFAWIKVAIATFIIWCAIIFVINMLFYWEKIIGLGGFIKRKLLIRG